MTGLSNSARSCAGSVRAPGPLERLSALAAGGPVLLMTARFGRSPVREAAYRFRAKHRDLDLKLSWRLFSSLEDWAKRWAAEQEAFAAGLIVSPAGDPVTERAVGRCLFDLAQLGRPLLWGVAKGLRIRWHPWFTLTPNGWPPEVMLPHPAAYARLGAADDIPEFCPQFDPILYSPEPDFFTFSSRLRWWEARHSLLLTRPGEGCDG